jgi:hypothetical protein
MCLRRDKEGLKKEGNEWVDGGIGVLGEKTLRRQEKALK